MPRMRKLAIAAAAVAAAAAAAAAVAAAAAAAAADAAAVAVAAAAYARHVGTWATLMTAAGVIAMISMACVSVISLTGHGNLHSLGLLVPSCASCESVAAPAQYQSRRASVSTTSWPRRLLSRPAKQPAEYVRTITQEVAGGRGFVVFFVVIDQILQRLRYRSDYHDVKCYLWRQHQSTGLADPRADNRHAQTHARDSSRCHAKVDTPQPAHQFARETQPVPSRQEVADRAR